MGLDIVYLPPIHPIGTAYRKGADNNLVAAGSVIIALPLLIVFFVLQRHFVAGLTLGATKG